MKTAIEMAREAGAIVLDGSDTTVIERFAELVRADEREECVKRAEVAMLGANRELTLRLISAIRNRSNT